MYGQWGGGASPLAPMTTPLITLNVINDFFFFFRYNLLYKKKYNFKSFQKQ